MCWLRPCVAKIEIRITRRVNEDAVAFCRHIERHWRMRVTGVHFGIGVDARDLLLAALRERHELQAEPENLFLRAQRQVNFVATRQVASTDGREWRSFNF